MGILTASKQVRGEAVDIFERENTYVRITWRSAGVYDSWYDKLRRCGVVTNYTRHGLVPPSTLIRMTLEIKKINATTGLTIEHPDLHTCIITVEDLPASCIFLQRQLREYKQFEFNLSFRMTIHPSPGDQFSGIPTSTLNTLLKPLSTIRGADQVRISGSDSRVPSDEIMATMRALPPSAQDVMNLVGLHYDRGDIASADGNPALAISEHKTALDTLRAAYFSESEKNEKLMEGRFRGMLAGWYE